MNIAINTRSFSKKLIPENSIEQILIAFAKTNTNHQFIFFTDETIESSENILALISKSTSSPISAKLWHSLQLPALIKKHKVDLLINTRTIYPIKTKALQLQLIDHLSILTQSKKNTAVTFSTTKKIIATTDFIKNKISETYKTPEAKIEVVYNAANSKFSAIDWKEKATTLEKYADGKEYFLSVDENLNEDNLITLLKAFSIFKKWQKSNLQLIIATNKKGFPSSFVDRLKKYKYRNEVLLLSCNEDEMAEIFGAAYCHLNLNEEGYYLSILQAIQCKVPTIVANTDLNKEIGGDALLFVDPKNHDDISKKMILAYKDENLRNELICKGDSLMLKYQHTKAVAEIGRIIQETTQG